MNDENERLKILQEAIEKCIEQQGYEIETVDLQPVHESEVQGADHSGGQTAAEFRARIVRKHGILNYK